MQQKPNVRKFGKKYPELMDSTTEQLRVWHGIARNEADFNLLSITTCIYSTVLGKVLFLIQLDHEQLKRHILQKSSFVRL